MHGGVLLMDLLHATLCYPVPSYVGWYLQASILLTLLILGSKSHANKKSQLSYFLVLFLPFISIPYLLVIKQQANEELNGAMFIPWLIIVLLFASTRICLYI